jgi:hypothetical protein
MKVVKTVIFIRFDAQRMDRLMFGVRVGCWGTGGRFALVKYFFDSFHMNPAESGAFSDFCISDLSDFLSSEYPLARKVFVYTWHASGIGRFHVFEQVGHAPGRSPSV